MCAFAQQVYSIEIHIFHAQYLKNVGEQTHVWCTHMFTTYNLKATYTSNECILSLSIPTYSHDYKPLTHVLYYNHCII